MLISPAYAQATGLMDQSALVQFLPFVLIFVVFYFLLIRPQQKKRSSTARCSKRCGAATGSSPAAASSAPSMGGEPEEVEVDIADGVRVRVVRSTITSVLAKPDPARGARGGERARPRGRQGRQGKGTGQSAKLDKA